MAMYTSAVTLWTPAATAEGAITTSNNAHMVRTTSATNRAKINEILIGGGATSSTVNDVGLRRMTTNSTTPTARVPVPMDPYSAAAVFSSYITASTMPTTAALATLQHVLNFTYNAFGGVVRWVAIPGGEVVIITSTASNSDIGLVNLNGTGPQSSHYVVEET